MIVKGSLIKDANNARNFAKHLFKEENEVVEVWKIPFGNGSQVDISNNLQDWMQYCRMTRGTRAIFHTAISPPSHEKMTPPQWRRAVAAIEEEFNLMHQESIQVFHQKKGRPHLHVLWSLTDLQERKLIRVSMYKRRLLRLARELEREFGHELTPSIPNEQTLKIDNADRMRQARTGRSAVKRKRYITRLWKEAQDSQSLLLRLKEAGYVLAKGNKSKYVLIEPNGEPCNFVKQLPKLIRLKEVDARLHDIYQQLPEVEEIKREKAQQKMRKQSQVKKRLKLQLGRNEKKIER